MSIDVIVPIADLDDDRLRAWNWVQLQYEEHHPNWHVIPGVISGTWSKACAVEAGLKSSTADVIMIADADVWIERLDLYVDAVVDGDVRWACPHIRVFRFNEMGTDMIIGQGMSPIDAGLHRGVMARTPYQRTLGGGLVIMERTLYDESPLDPRFEGWGGEDRAWGYSLMTIGGRRMQGKEICWHLWHRPQERLAKIYAGNAEEFGPAEALADRYQHAMDNVDAMRALIEEGRQWQSTRSSSIR